MSTKENDVWLEAAVENFDTAIQIGNYAMAKDIIADTLDRGFTKEAQEMNLVLRNTPVQNFALKSPYPNI